MGDDQAPIVAQSEEKGTRVVRSVNIDRSRSDLRADSRPVRHSRRTSRTVIEAFSESDEDPVDKDEDFKIKTKTTSIPSGDKAISKTGYTCRGRVKQKAQKRVELINLGERRLAKKWSNSGCIFPLGFKSRTDFRSSVNLDSVCQHECEIVKGKFWPEPTFVIIASDRPNEKLYGKSCTACWNQVMGRIRSEIVRRRKAGENLPPPPKTAIAGPEYFGLIQENILRKIESLDPDKQCSLYWEGKLERKKARENLIQESKGKSKSGRGRGRRKKEFDSEESEEDNDVDDSLEYTSNKWSLIERSDRYKRRCIKRGGEDEEEGDGNNPLPGMVDVLTSRRVETPAISPYGHVIDLSTWKVWLSDNKTCPFTRKPLSIEQLTVLTKHNIDRYRDRIVNAEKQSGVNGTNL